MVKICSEVVYHKPSLLDSFEIIVSDQCFIRFTLVWSRVVTYVPQCIPVPCRDFFSHLDCLNITMTGYKQLL